MFGEDQNKARPAISFVEPGKHQQKALSKIEQVNGITNFAILKTTDGGRYMRGNKLFFCLNGVSVYTEPDNIIFVDIKNNTMWIKEYEKVLNEINPVDPEHKQYIMLYTDLGYDSDDANEFPLRWEAVTGRTSAYENIKINSSVIDIDKSLVLVESVTIKDALTVRQFIDYLKNGDIINEEGFDINDYSGSEYI